MFSLNTPNQSWSLGFRVEFLLENLFYAEKGRTRYDGRGQKSEQPSAPMGSSAGGLCAELALFCPFSHIKVSAAME